MKKRRQIKIVFAPKITFKPIKAKKETKKPKHYVHSPKHTYGEVIGRAFFQ